MRTRSLLITILGGISFWLPVTLIELMTKSELSIVVGSLLPPTTLLLCYFFARRNHVYAGRSISLWMLLGVYVLGPSFMMIGAGPRHVGSPQLRGWSDVKLLLICSLIPIITVGMSFYDGTVFGLLSATVLMLIIHFTSERKSATTNTEAGA